MSRWTEQDINNLKQLLDDPFLSFNDISKKINRTVVSIRFKMKELKLRKLYPRGIKDISNFENNDIKILSLNGKDGKNINWNFLCKKCNTTKVGTSKIINQQSCGCDKSNQNIKNKYIGVGNLSGKKFLRIKTNAKARNIEFKVSIEELWNLFLEQDSKCAISGQKIFLYKEAKRINDCTASLDRKDSRKNYTIDNVQWVHKDINLMKLDHSTQEYIQLCKKVVDSSFKKKEKIAVWGGTGFIGSVLVTKLLEYGYQVIVFDNLFKPIDSILTHFSNPDFKFIELDIGKEKDVIKSFEYDFDCIIALSGIVGVPACNKHSLLATLVNDIGWSYLAKHKPKKIKLLAASTGSVYGSIENGLCTEETVTKPLSHYGITKLAGENHVVNAGGIAYRFATAAGVSPAIRLNLLPNYMVHQAIHEKYINIFEPHNMRTFIDIRDFCQSFIFGIEHFNKFKYQIYNIGDERNNLSKIELAKYIKKQTDCFLACNETHKDADARNYSVDYSRINNEGFSCEYLIQDTIDELIKTMPYVRLDQKYW